VTAEDKIKEAEYNLDKLKNASNLDQEFQFELSNFLGSCYSILEHLLEDHNQKFGFSLDYVTSKTFRDKANKMRNADALKFINWYDNEKLKLRNEKSYGFLVARRRHSVHKSTVKAEHMAWVKVDLKLEFTDGTKRDVDLGKHTWRFFEERKGQDGIMICTEFLNHLKRIVHDSQRQE